MIYNITVLINRLEAKVLESSFSIFTPTTQILIHTKATLVDCANLIEYENQMLFSALCKVGCPNYGNKWACPPYSPTFSRYSIDYSRALLVVFYCYLDQFHYTKTEYMRIKASNSILKSRMDNFMRSLEKQVGGKMISNGSCRLCKPCAQKGGTMSRCKKPDQMRFSLESLGLDVSGISRDYFKHDLLWYKDKKSPLYSSVVSALLTNTQIDQIDFTSMFSMNV